MSRLEANKEIVRILSEIVDKHPDLRFAQILHRLKLDEDHFYQESERTLEVTNWKVLLDT